MSLVLYVLYCLCFITMAKAFPEDLAQAEALVDGLLIEDLRVFCSSYGLEDTGTKIELKRRLLQYYRSNIEVDDHKRTVHDRGISVEKQLEKSEERIARVEHSVYEMQSAIQNEFLAFR